MVKSMTGFAREVLQLPTKKLTIEIKSLNSKQLDLFTRVPSYYREKEIEIRKFITEKTVRGKVEMSVFAEVEEDNPHVINRNIVSSYMEQLNTIMPGLAAENRLQMSMRLPDVLKIERAELDQNEWKALEGGIARVCTQLDEFRTREGANLARELVKYVENIRVFLTQVDAFETDRIVFIREKMQKALSEFDGKIDANRFEQELIYYMEKLDVTEEKVRLTSHIDYFLQVMEDEEDCGKKLGFIAQEMGREINTLGSKSNNAEMQKIVVRMKDELEKIKEQVLNVL